MSMAAAMIREAIRRDGTDSARTTQSDQHLIGPSEIGGCRAYLAHMVARTPRIEPADDIKLPAFLGTAAGDRIEAAWKRIDPSVRTQVPITATLPSGLTVSGSADIVTDAEVVDLKSKDGLALIRRSGPTFQQKAQIQVYLLGAIQEGILPPAATGTLAFYDRSGKDDQPAVFEYTLDMDVIAEIDSRLEDVLYAAEYDLDSAPRDAAYEFCASYCAFFHACRGKDEHIASGLVTDEAHLAAVKAYTDALAMQREATQIKDEAKAVLAGVQGRAGDVEVTWTHVGDTTIPTYVRQGFDRLSIRKAAGAKRGAKK